MEKVDGIRDSMNGSAKLNRRLHAWSFRKLQMYVKYKANLWKKYFEAGSPLH